jgi:Transposase
VHSTTLANYRKSFSPSGAKSDPQDGDLILDLLLKHSERLRRLQPDTVETRSLQFLTQERRKLIDLYTAESQRLINWLKQVFPQILRWFDNPATPLVGDLLLRWPTLQQLQKASPKTLLHFLHQHNCRRQERIQQRLAEIRQATPAITDAALLATGTLCIQNSIRALAQMRIGMAAFDRQIAGTYRSIRTGPSSSPSRELDRRWNPGSSRPSARSAIASIRPPAWPVLPASLRSRRAAATPAGLTGAGLVPSSSGKLSTNGPAARSVPATGHALTTTNSVPRGRAITPRYAPWPTSGFASSSAAGAIARALLRATLPPSPAHSCDPAQLWPNRFSASVTAADAVEKLCRVLQTRAAFLLTD